LLSIAFPYLPPLCNLYDLTLARGGQIHTPLTGAAFWVHVHPFKLNFNNDEHYTPTPQYTYTTYVVIVLCVLTEKLTCSRRLSWRYQLYNHSEQMQKATIQQSAEGASQVQWVLGSAPTRQVIRYHLIVCGVALVPYQWRRQRTTLRQHLLLCCRILRQDQPRSLVR
jgi:hypothetical protein